MKKFFYKIRALFLLPVLGMTVACDDWFTFLPQSEMVAEDFWKDEQDVKSAVGQKLDDCGDESIRNDG